MSYLISYQQREAEIQQREQARAALFNVDKPDDVTDDDWKRIKGLGCCPQARIQRCVCMVSFRCPTHDVRCHGTHD